MLGSDWTFGYVDREREWEAMQLHLDYIPQSVSTSHVSDSDCSSLRYGHYVNDILYARM